MTCCCRPIAETLKVGAGARNQVIRWGGDEFMIVMPGADLKDAERLVKRIKEQLTEIRINGTIEASVSFGMALKQSRDDEPRAVLKKAEEMMYQIKLLESKSMRGTTINALLAALDEKNAETKAYDAAVRSRHEAGRPSGPQCRSRNRLMILLTMLHDIGKVGIPDHILGKPGRLTEAEWQIMQTHSEIGYRIAANVRNSTSSPRKSSTIMKNGTDPAILRASAAKRSRSTAAFWPSSMPMM